MCFKARGLCCKSQVFSNKGLGNHRAQGSESLKMSLGFGVTGFGVLALRFRCASRLRVCVASRRFSLTRAMCCPRPVRMAGKNLAQSSGHRRNRAQDGGAVEGTFWSNPLALGKCGGLGCGTCTCTKPVHFVSVRAGGGAWMWHQKRGRTAEKERGV